MNWNAQDILSTHPQVVVEWDLASDLKRCFLPRFVIACILGTVLGFSAKIVGVSSLGYGEMALASSFWVAALMVATFKGHAGRMLFWLLLMEAGLALYQVSIYSVVMEHYIWVRIGPAILGGILFFATFRGYSQQSSSLYIVWIACNLPSLVSGATQGVMDPLNAIMFWAFNVLYPLVFYFAIGAMKRSDLPQQMLCDCISFAVLAMCFTPLVLIPIELMARQTANFAELQFGGRAYAVIGAIILTFPAILASTSRWRLLYRLLATILILMVFASSFSRGALITFLSLAIGIFAFGNVHRGKMLFGGGATILFLIALGWLVMPEVISAIAWFWLLRMNVVSNLTSGVSFDASSMVQSGRFEIWDIASSLSLDNPIWGFGIGSTPSLLFAASSGEFTYSGMHNMMLTVLVERGIFGLIGAFVILGRIGYLIYLSKNPQTSRMFMGYAFILFLIFANGTGVELFQNSTRSLNVTITVTLILVIGYLEYGLSKPIQSDQLENSSTKSDGGGVN